MKDNNLNIEDCNSLTSFANNNLGTAKEIGNVNDGCVVEIYNKISATRYRVSYIVTNYTSQQQQQNQTFSSNGIVLVEKVNNT